MDSIEYVSVNFDHKFVELIYFVINLIRKQFYEFQILRNILDTYKNF